MLDEAENRTPRDYSAARSRPPAALPPNELENDSPPRGDRYGSVQARAPVEHAPVNRRPTPDDQAVQRGRDYESRGRFSLRRALSFAVALLLLTGAAGIGYLYWNHAEHSRRPTTLSSRRAPFPSPQKSPATSSPFR